MQIQLVGFEWTATPHISVADLCKHLHAKRNKAIKHFGYDRVLFTARANGRLLGVFLTIKDQKSIAAIDVASYRISVQKLKAGTQLVDFNFFAVNEVTGKGLYSYYHNSAGVSAFNEFVSKRFTELSQEKKKDESRGLKGNKADKSKRASIAQKYSKALETKQMIRKEQLPVLLARLKRIRTFEFDATTVIANDSWFRPLANEVTSRKIKLRFDADAQIGTLRERIVDVVKGQRITAGRIEGEGEDKVREIIQIIDTPDSFGHYDFDSVVSDGMIDYGHVENSPFLGTIVHVLSHQSHHFGTTS